MKTTSILNHVIGPVMRGPSSSHTVAMGGGGAETPEYAIRQQINTWLVKTPPMGK